MAEKSREFESDIESEWDSDASETYDSDEEKNEDTGNPEDNIPEQTDPLQHVVFGEKVVVDVAPKFGLTGASYFFSFKNQNNIIDGEKVARSAFDVVLKDAFSEAGPSDLVGVSIAHPALDHEILLPFGNRNQTTSEAVMNLIANVQQSKKELDFDNTMNVKVTKITPPEGRGFRKMAKGRFEDVFKRHSGGHGSTFIQIKNDDWLCFARAVVVAKARVQYYKLGNTTVKWDTIKRGDSKKNTLQRILALDLMSQARLLGHTKRSCGYPEFKKIQDILVREGFQLKIFSYDHFDALIFDEGVAGCIPLYIYHHEDHYTPMSSPRILTGTNKYCDLCNHGYNREEEHNCPKYCYSCREKGQCAESGNRVHCKMCSRNFKSQKCFENHKLRPESIVLVGRKRKKALGLSVCMRLKGCRSCGKTVAKSRLAPEKHKCGQRYCSTCKTWDTNGEDYLCFMQPMKDKGSGRVAMETEETGSDPDDLDALIREEEDRQGETDTSRTEHFRKSGCQDSNVSKYLFWDFETIQQDVLKEKTLGQKKEYSLGPVYLHKPNYAIVRKACMLCKDFWLSKCSNATCKSHSCEDCQRNKPNCAVCKEHITRFSGESCRDEFCDYLFREKHKGITAIAHNSKGLFINFTIISDFPVNFENP